MEPVGGDDFVVMCHVFFKLLVKVCSGKARQHGGYIIGLDGWPVIGLSLRLRSGKL
jgi:hypothetical protein